MENGVFHSLCNGSNCTEYLACVHLIVWPYDTGEIKVILREILQNKYLQ